MQTPVKRAKGCCYDNVKLKFCEICVTSHTKHPDVTGCRKTTEVD